MTSLSGQVQSLREHRAATAREFAGLAVEQLTCRAALGERQSDVRHVLLRLADADDERRAALGPIYAALGWQQSEAQRILGTAAEVRGQDLAQLVGLPDDYLGRVAWEGEWSIGQILDHVRVVEEAYLAQTAYAVERYHDPALPAQMPADRLPPRPAGGPISPPALGPALARLVAVRAELVARLAGLTPEELGAPSSYGRMEVTVRFRMHRFASHEREHNAQIAKTLVALGWGPTEAQVILGYAEISRGALEGALVGLPDELAARSPGVGLLSVQELFARALAEAARAALG